MSRAAEQLSSKFISLTISSREKETRYNEMYKRSRRGARPIIWADALPSEMRRILFRQDRLSRARESSVDLRPMKRERVCPPLAWSRRQFDSPPCPHETDVPVTVEAASLPRQGATG